MDHAAEQERMDDNDEDNDDIDASLAYLHERQADRARGVAPGAAQRRARGASSTNDHEKEKWSPRSSQPQSQASTLEMYREAQEADRKWRERNDAKMKIWGKFEDDLDERRQRHQQQQGQGQGQKQGPYGGKSANHSGRGGGGAEEEQQKSKVETLEGQEFLDAML